MNRPTFLPLLAAALVGGALAGAGVSTLQCAATPRTVDLTPGAEVAADARLEVRLDALAEENAGLRARLAELELRPDPAPRWPELDFATREELDALRDELRSSLASAPEGGAPGQAAPFEARVEDALSAIRRREAVDAVRARQEKRTARLDQDLAMLGKRLELAPYQTEELRVALLAQYDREAELRTLWEEGTDPVLLGERKGEIAESFRADLERFLSPDQLETFWITLRRGGKR